MLHIFSFSQYCIFTAYLLMFCFKISHFSCIFTLFSLFSLLYYFSLSVFLQEVQYFHRKLSLTMLDRHNFKIISHLKKYLLPKLWLTESWRMNLIWTLNEGTSVSVLQPLISHICCIFVDVLHKIWHFCPVVFAFCFACLNSGPEKLKSSQLHE